jgi:hypothetical protein
MMIEIRFDENKIRQVERMLAAIPGALPKVMSRGINRSADHARTLFSRLINERFKIGVRKARKEVYLRRASQNTWRAKVSVSNFRPSIMLLRHAFIAVGAKKGKQVWLRSLYQIGHRKYIDWRGRRMESLYQQRASGFSETLYETDQDRISAIYAESLAKLEKNIHDQVQLILRRRAG